MVENVTAVMPHFGKKISDLMKFCKDNNLIITDTNGDGLFDRKDRIEYTVQKGDTLFGIGRRYKEYGIKAIQKANKGRFKDFGAIKPGDSVIISASEAPKKVVMTSAPQTRKQPAPKPAEKTPKQVTIMLDAGHGNGEWLQRNQNIVIPGQKKPYTTKAGDTFENIAKVYKVDTKTLMDTNKQVKVSRDPGAVPSKEIGEHDEAYFTGIAREELAAKLKSMGFRVVMSPRTDKPHLANRQSSKLTEKPDMFLSLHCDASDNKQASGSTVIYNGATKEDKAFAEIMNDSLKAGAEFKNRGLSQRDNLCVLRGDKNGQTAELLIEMGFITNKADYAKLNDANARKKLIEAIANGCYDYSKRDAS